MASARSFPMALAAVAALAAWSCGGGSSAVGPTSPTPVPQPTPTPAGDGSGASASSCPIGKGSLTTSCQKGSPELLSQVESAIDRLVREHPEIFNLEEDAGGGQYRVRKADAYLDGVVANLVAAGLCAERSMDRERVVLKSTNAFSEEWDVLASTNFVRRGRSSYVHTCTPASFPVDPADVIANVRVVFFGYDCLPGVVAPGQGEKRIPVGCDGFVTATPWTSDGQKVPSWVHGPEVEWELRSGAEVIRVDPDTRFGNPFNRIVRPSGTVGSFVLCATVLGKEGCLSGNAIP